MENVRQPSLMMIGALYFCFYVMGFAIAFGLLTVLASQTSLDPSGAGMGIVIPMMAALQCGAYYYRKTGQRPGRGYFWAAALVMFVVVLAVAAFQFWAALRLGLFEGQIPGFSWSNPQDRNIVLIVGAVVLCVVFVINAAGFWSGARGAKKQVERRRLRAEKKAAKLAAKNQG
ncbi:MAG: ABZJ_00895 family protein [Paracoccus sp. (in: a-proteobacteria)]